MKDDDRILLRPPSTASVMTMTDDGNGSIQPPIGFDNPVAEIEETSIEFTAKQNGAAAGDGHVISNGTSNGKAVEAVAVADVNGAPPKTKGEEAAEDAEEDEPTCGWWQCRPNCAQSCNNIIGYSVFLSIFVIAQGMTVNGLVYVVITTLERRFGFPSVKSGFISSTYDFTVMVIIIFVTYFGERAHKPIWLGVGAFLFGCGSLVFTLPHFLTGEYEYQSENFELCDTNRTQDYCDTQTQDSNLDGYYAVFILAQVIHGLGASPLYTLGVTYIDENVSAASSGIYIGVFKSMAILGPAIGYIVGGIFLGIYTDIQKDDDLDITAADPTWVGAWWLGFLVSAIISFIIVIPFFGFPKSLPGGKKIFAQRRVETQKGMEFETKTGLKAIRQFPKAIWVIITNLPFMFNSLSTACETFALVAVGVFGPKYIESQFNITAGNAAILAGLIVTPASFVGALFGGWVVKRYDLKYPGMMKFSLVCLIFCFGFQFMFLQSCQNVDFAGVTVEYGASPSRIDGESNITAGCNGDCMCNNKFQPLCGEDNVMYYSPCHAGCTGKGHNKSEAVLYSQCDCIPPLNTTDGTPLGGGQGGRCDSECKFQSTFLGVTFLLITTASMVAVPMTTATLRCVAPSQRTFALGIQSVIYRCLGSVPAPLIYGALIDQSCLIWEDECDGSRTCWMYDNVEFSRNTLIILQSAKAVSIVSIVLAIVSYRPIDSGKDEVDGADVDIDAQSKSASTKDVVAEIPRIEDDNIEMPQV